MTGRAASPRVSSGAPPGRAAKRKRGKQPGAPGSAMSWAEPDLGVARSFQQLEIPEPSAQRIQHDLHLGLCVCGGEHVAARPAGVPDAVVSIGPNLRALAVYLVVFQHMPIRRCRDLIGDVAGAQVSAGFIHSCLRKAAELAAGVVKLIRTLRLSGRGMRGNPSSVRRTGTCMCGLSLWGRSIMWRSMW